MHAASVRGFDITVPPFELECRVEVGAALVLCTDVVPS